MAIGTIDIVYTVRLGDGNIVKTTSRQLAIYKFFAKYLAPIFKVLFFPVRMVYKLVMRRRGRGNETAGVSYLSK
jgi:hypothetical protein